MPLSCAACRYGRAPPRAPSARATISPPTRAALCPPTRAALCPQTYIELEQTHPVDVERQIAAAFVQHRHQLIDIKLNG